jgi:hypothetical protein
MIGGDQATLGAIVVMVVAYRRDGCRLSLPGWAAIEPR